MNDNENPRTTRDALILEAIHEIDLLINKVEGVESITKVHLNELETKLIEIITKAETHFNNLKADFHEFTEYEKGQLQASVYKATDMLEKAGQRMASNISRPEGLPTWKQAMILLVIAVITSILSIVGSYWMFGSEQSSQAAMGKAVIDVWDDLDEKTKIKIEQAL